MVRPIYLAHVDKTRPVLVLTRDAAFDLLTKVTVAPITSTIRGIKTEVAVGERNGLDRESVVSCDNVVTIRKDLLVARVGFLMHEQEPALAAALRHAFELVDE